MAKGGHGRTDGWKDGRTEGQKDGRKEGRTDGRLEIPPCVLQDIGPLWPLPKKHISELSCSFARVSLCILAHLAHSAQSFFIFLMG